MQECGTSTGKSVHVKRVTVRSGGAGHAHSGVVKACGMPVQKSDLGSLKGANGKIVTLGG